MKSTKWIATAAMCLVVSTAAAEPGAFPQFKTQEIDSTLKVGYGVRIADLNSDGKPDIIVADADRVIWFSNPDWKLHTIIENAKAGVKADNVCLAIHDVDGDGKLDIALGADWQPNNTATGGSLQWLRQGKTIDEWTVHPIAASIPTLHRIQFAVLMGDAKPKLIVSPLKGKGSTASKNWMDSPAPLTAWEIPADPLKDPWKSTVLSDALHGLHNFFPLPGQRYSAVLTASYEGVSLISQTSQGPALTQLGGGNQQNPSGSRGSGEAKPGTIKNAISFFAAIEPFHGHEVVVYPSSNAAARRVIDDQFKAGHALWCADLNGDGVDEIIAGFREPTAKGDGPGIRAYQLTGEKVEATSTWTKHLIDEKEMATEDLTCADLNADGKIDIIAVGRSTKNVRIYWNQGQPPKE